MLEDLRQATKDEEFFEEELLLKLTEFEDPRKEIKRLIACEDIIHVANGVYVFGEKYRKDLRSEKILSQMIYSPSYVSLESALSEHGLIPEGVYSTTSVTTLESKEFYTPFDRFSYDHIDPNKYEVGIEKVNVSDHRYYWIATPEKALSDKLHTHTYKPARNLEELELLLFRNWRIDEDELEVFDLQLVEDIARIFQHLHTDLLCELVKKMQSTKP